ncbi:hypothetical protein KUTeg_015463 [Tegillarca granosa]|uniref:HTH psq-type domain-containing protein n=1 Tax=Tegillarca granosa TaxID=220873 RepID=A0ABQ9EQS8_TEGGR|nr:hypothetical protein KUTeg_015463 [Tegillarca granosa]
MRQKQVNPQQIKNLYRVYSPSSMTNAFLAVKEQNMSVKRASRQYNVPETTLRQRILGRVSCDTTSSGTPPILSQEEEAVFVEHLKAMANMGYGYTRTEVVQMASEYAVTLQKRDREHPFILKWFRKFMGRWPELSVNKPRSLSVARAKATSKDVVDTYFQSLKEILDKYGLQDKPENIYNVDEKVLQTEHSPPYVVGPRVSTVSAVTSGKSTTTTVIGCGNALGVSLPPYFIFKGQRMRQELLDGCSEGTGGTVSESAHTSHVLQPLDLGCFGPFQRIYNSECHKFIRQNPSSTITRYNICSIACRSYIHALSPANLQSSFRKSGIYPYNPSTVDELNFKPSFALKSSCHTVTDE